MNHTIVELVLVFVLIFFAIAWVVLHFFLIERWLQKIVGFLFGITIGGSEFIRIYRGLAFTGWTVSSPDSSGCIFRLFIWAIGFVQRWIIVGGSLGVILVIIGFLINAASRP